LAEQDITQDVLDLQAAVKKLAEMGLPGRMAGGRIPKGHPVEAVAWWLSRQPWLAGFSMANLLTSRSYPKHYLKDKGLKLVRVSKW